MVWGTILLFIDSILIVLDLRAAAAMARRPPDLLRILLSAAMVLTFDQLGFFAALLRLHRRAGAASSMAAGSPRWRRRCSTASLAGVYLRWVETRAVRARRCRPNLSDVFDTLTYRQRYEALLQQTGRDSLTGVLDRGRFDRDGRAPSPRRSPPAGPSACSSSTSTISRLSTTATAMPSATRCCGRSPARSSRATRDVDHVYRYGGEEFVVICDGLAYPSALLAAERLRRGVGATVIDGIDSAVTISIGVATAPEDGRDLATLFETADARLYTAKAEGRDRVVGRPPPAIEEPPFGARRPA